MSEPTETSVAVAWVNVHEQAVQFVNQFAVQLGPPVGQGGAPDGIYVLAGVLTPPILVGDPEQLKAQVAAIQAVPVRPVAQLVMNPEHAVVLRDALNQILGQYDALMGGGAVGDA